VVTLGELTQQHLVVRVQLDEALELRRSLGVWIQHAPPSYRAAAAASSLEH